MADLTTRILIGVAVLGAAAMFVTQCTGEGEGEGSAAEWTGRSTDVGDGPHDVDGMVRPPEGPGVVQGGAEDQPAPQRPAALGGDDRRDVGPGAEPGTAIDVTPPWRKGTEHRYDIRRWVVQIDRNTGHYVSEQRVFDVTATVTKRAAAGAARVRMVVNSARIGVILSSGYQYEYDSSQPDELVAKDENTAKRVLPFVSHVGIPVEFVLDEHGKPVDVEGVDRWEAAWEDAMEEALPGGSKKFPNNRTKELVLVRWSRWLFPPQGTGELAAGAERQVDLVEDHVVANYVTFRGGLRATHDDGRVFRTALTCTPGVLPRAGASRSPSEDAVEKAHVQTDADSFRAAWRFDRELGGLLDSEIDAKYQLWVSRRTGSGRIDMTNVNESGVAEGLTPTFMDVLFRTRVNRVEK